MDLLGAGFVYDGRAALAGQARVTHLARTEMLWRLVLRSARLPARRLRPLADAWRAVELRRIAEGTLPAVGILAAAASRPCAGPAVSASA